MNLRETFDKVKAHLLEQNCVATSFDGRCLYRGDGGTSCAVGCLIEDKFYHLDLEGNSVKQRCVKEALQMSGVEIDETTLDMLVHLQHAHDSHYVEDWPAMLDSIEKKYFGGE